MHRRVGATVTGDAADRRLPLMVKPREVPGRHRDQTAEFLLVEVAGDAEPVVTLLDGQARQKGRGDHEGPDAAAHPQREPPDEPRSDGRAPTAVRLAQRTVTITGFANMTRADAPAGPPRGNTWPVAVVTVPTAEARSEPKWNAAAIE